MLKNRETSTPSSPTCPYPSNHKLIKDSHSIFLQHIKHKLTSTGGKCTHKKYCLYTYTYCTTINVLKRAQTQSSLLPLILPPPPVIVFLCFPIEPFCGEVTCSFSLVGLPQLSVAALWQTSAESSSAQASQGITRAAWTAAGEFNFLLASVCHPPSLSFLLLLCSLFFPGSSDVFCAAFFCIVQFFPLLIVLENSLLALCMYWTFQ